MYNRSVTAAAFISQEAPGLWADGVKLRKLQTT